MKPIIITKRMKQEGLPSVSKDGNRLSLMANETYGFNPGETISINTGLEFDIPKKKRAVIIPEEKTVSVVGDPVIKGKGLLTITLCNTSSDAYIISRNEKICDILVLKSTDNIDVVLKTNTKGYVHETNI